MEKEDPARSRPICKSCNEWHVELKPIDPFLLNCNLCSRIRTEKIRLRWIRHRKNSLIPCSPCWNSFRKKGRLRKHDCSRPEGANSCWVCGQQLESLSSLHQHLKILHHCTGSVTLSTNNVKRFNCDICGRFFTWPWNLKMHQRVHGKVDLVISPDNNDKKADRETCGKSFPGLWNLKLHQKTHDQRTEEMKFQCEVCAKLFSRAHNLNLHRRIHSGTKPFVCDVCKKAFTRYHHLVEHKRIHNGVKPFPCDVCGMAFSRAHHLEVHKRRHSGSKQFKCHICVMEFTMKHHLDRHLRTHSKCKPYVCDVCGKGFSSTRYRAHKKLHK